MTQWAQDQLDKLASGEEVQVSSTRRDGTLGKPVTIWVVRHDDGLYVRSVRGPGGHWFRGTLETREGRIGAGDVQQDVTFQEADHDIDDQIDAAYRTKYRRYIGPILNSVLTPEARSTTLVLIPRSRSVKVSQSVD